MQPELDFDAVTFSPEVAEKSKQEGMGRAAWSRRELLWRVQEALEQIASRRPNRTATADDGQNFLISKGYKAEDLGNAAGSMFKRDKWVCIGRTPSERVSRHGNEVRVWKLK